MGLVFCVPKIPIFVGVLGTQVVREKSWDRYFWYSQYQHNKIEGNIMIFLDDMRISIKRDKDYFHKYYEWKR